MHPTQPVECGVSIPQAAVVNFIMLVLQACGDLLKSLGDFLLFKLLEEIFF